MNDPSWTFTDWSTEQNCRWSPDFILTVVIVRLMSEFDSANGFICYCCCWDAPISWSYSISADHIWGCVLSIRLDKYWLLGSSWCSWLHVTNFIIFGIKKFRFQKAGTNFPYRLSLRKQGKLLLNQQRLLYGMEAVSGWRASESRFGCRSMMLRRTLKGVSLSLLSSWYVTCLFLGTWFYQGTICTAAQLMV